MSGVFYLGPAPGTRASTTTHLGYSAARFVSSDCWCISYDRHSYCGSAFAISAFLSSRGPVVASFFEPLLACVCQLVLYSVLVPWLTTCYPLRNNLG